MTPRFSRLIVVVVGLALVFSLTIPLKSSAPAFAQSGVGLPRYRELVRATARASWDAAPQSRPGVPLVAMVQLELPPLAVAGPGWDHERRRAYLTELSAAQDRVAAEVTARGGRVTARFSHAAAGLAVVVDAGVVAELGQVAGVDAVLRVGDYAVNQGGAGAEAASLAQLSKLIGADEVRRRGVDGAGVEIAVVDTGVDYTHVKLGGPGDRAAYRRAVCGTAELEPGAPGCAGGTAEPPADLFPNAKVRGGYDFVGDVWPEPDPECGTLVVCENPDANPIDLSGHGTHVADIAAGLQTAPAAKDAGVAPGASIWAFKACNDEAGLCNGVALLSAVDAALDLDGSDRGACTPGVDAGCRVYDPADVINLSLSYRYGQPEDALTLFANIAGYYGALVVAAAGNDGDKPYIVGSPATAAAALAVAESAFPAGTATLSTGGRQIDALHLPWSTPLAEAAKAVLRVGDGQGNNADGCAPLPAWQGSLLLERGGCSADVKAAHAASAGASMLLVADNGHAAAPPALVGAGAALPVFSLTSSEGRRLRSVAAKALVLVEAGTGGEQIAADASRGPRIADTALKPDLAVPGAVNSARVGTGDGLAAFGGSSGAAPAAAGVAALVIQELEAKNVLDADPGLGLRVNDSLRLSLAPLVKAVLMNSAVSDLRTDTGALAPLTLQGAGRVNAFASYTARTMAWDASSMIAFLAADPELVGCSVTPYRDLLNYIFFRIMPPCAAFYPGGDALLSAWNAQSGSVSFGYRPAVGFQELQRQVVVQNYSRSPRSYTLGTSLRFPDDAGRGVSLSVTPENLTLPGGGYEIVTLTLTISPGALRDWTLNGGRLGNSGSAACDSPNPELDCPSLTLFEVDGALTIDGGERNRIAVPIHVLPRRAADVAVSRVLENSLWLANYSTLTSGESEVFGLVDSSLNKCDIWLTAEECLDDDYAPGARPGLGRSPVDISLVGVRSYSVPGLNAELGLSPAPQGALADEVIEFAVTVFDKPYRASPNFPVQFEIHIDSSLDGSVDYVIFNADLDGGRDGRNAVFVRDVDASSGIDPARPYLFTVADFNSQNWVLPVPAAAVGLRSDRQFRWYVLAYDAYFRASGSVPPWDCSPYPDVGGACGSKLHTTQTGAPRFVLGSLAEPMLSVTAPPGARLDLPFAEITEHAVRSPSQIGLLLLHRDAMPGRESSRVQLR